MKVYEVRAGRVTIDGYPNGYETIAYVVDEAKGREVAEAWRVENEVNQWWCGYSKEDGHIRIEVKELGEIVE